MVKPFILFQIKRDAFLVAICIWYERFQVVCHTFQEDLWQPLDADGL